MKIREATETDIECWSQMRTELWPDSGEEHLSEIKDYFAGHSIDIAKTYLAEIDAEVIGFIELNIRHYAEGSRQSKVPYIEAWYIKPDFQSKGHGSQLIEHAENWALSLGFNELASDTETDNTRSISIHKYLGFAETERVVCFLKKLKNN